MRIAHFYHVPIELPTPSWLQDLLCYLEFDVQALAAQESRNRAAMFKVKLELDRKFACSRAGFDAIRKPPNPPFTQCLGSTTLRSTWLLEPRSMLMAGTKWPTAFRLSWCGVRWRRPRQLGFGFLATTCPLQDDCASRRPPALQSPEELQQAFEAYWKPIWQRDSALSQSRTEAQDAAYQPFLLQWCLTPLSVQVWKQAIARISCRKATGACGWAPLRP